MTCQGTTTTNANKWLECFEVQFYFLQSHCQMDDTMIKDPYAGPQSCDACPHCADVCDDPSCTTCLDKIKGDHSHAGGGSNSASETYKQSAVFTMCQVRRHNHETSTWLLVGKNIYDVTICLSIHPGGSKGILKKSGGVHDCTEDMTFHSRKTIRSWKQSKIGILVPCPGNQSIVSSDTAKSFMDKKGWQSLFSK